ncbi:unnamed protein product [Calypogeia fissa]
MEICGSQNCASRREIMYLPLTHSLDRQLSDRKVVCALPFYGDTARSDEANLSANRVTGSKAKWSNLTLSDVYDNTHDCRRGIDKAEANTEETSAASDTTVDSSVAPSTPPEEPCAKRRKYRGVRQRSKVKWAAQVHDPEKPGTVWLGTYDSPEEAAQAYDRAALRFHGPRAILNFPGKSHITKATTAAAVSFERSASGSDISSEVTDGSVSGNAAVTPQEFSTKSVPPESRTMLEYLLQSQENCTLSVNRQSSTMFGYLLQQSHGSMMINSQYSQPHMHSPERGSVDFIQPLHQAAAQTMIPFLRPAEVSTAADIDLDLHL